MLPRRLPLVLLVFVSALAVITPANAEAWPQRPVRIVVPYAPGGIADQVAHFAAKHLEEAFGQSFLIEHRPGATGAIAAEMVARAPPDGYTLLLANLPQIAIVPVMIRTSFDPRRDVVPISAIATNPLALVVHPSLPVRSVADFVDFARQQPDKLSYAATGVGSITHLAMALFLRRAGIAMTPIMYKGGAPAVADLIAGHVKTSFANVSGVMPYASGDMLRFLAVSTEQRLPQLADVPTVIEAGYPGFKALNWTGLMAPAGTPPEIIDRIAREVSRAAKDPKNAALLAANGIGALGSSSQEFAAMIAADIPMWAEAVRVAGIQEK